MKKMKFSVCALSLAMLLSSCGGMSNTAKGGLIGGLAMVRVLLLALL